MVSIHEPTVSGAVVGAALMLLPAAGAASAADMPSAATPADHGNVSFADHLSAANSAEDVLHSLERPGLDLILTRISALRSFGDNWDGFGSPAPAPEALKHAEELILAGLPEGIRSQEELPLVSADEFGALLLEWVGENRRVTLYVEGNEAEFVKASAGPNTVETTSHPFAGAETLAELISWATQSSS